jgi:tRNA(Ile)-lysidine synthase
MYRAIFRKDVSRGFYLWCMLQQFLNHIKQHNLCTPNDSVLLAISGGVDSMVMLPLFRDAGYTVGVAHCNFQLRGEESAGDEKLVEETCRKYNVPFFVKRFNTEQHARQQGISIQMAARELRYAWFQEIMDQEKYAWLATAHHLNDAMETVLLNWIHGSSLNGFRGIPVKNNNIIRPLLFASRKLIEDYAIANKILWREDSSNQTDDYQRNFIRNQVIPTLKRLNPSLEDTFALGQRKISGELAFLDVQLKNWENNHLKLKGEAILIEKRSITNPSILWKVIKNYGFNFFQCEDVIQSLNGQSGKKFLSQTHQLIIDRDHIIIYPTITYWGDILIEEGQPEAILGTNKLAINTVEDTVPIEASALTARVDADKLRFPLRWRKWKAGDFFYPLGMEHKRKLSDFLIDKKVSVAEKHYVTVLESDGDIVWVVGHRIDNRFKITPQTRSALCFTLIPYFK